MFTVSCCLICGPESRISSYGVIYSSPKMCPENALKLLFWRVSKLLKNYSKTTRLFFADGRCIPSQLKLDSTHAYHKCVSDVMLMRLFEVGAIVR